MPNELPGPSVGDKFPVASAANVPDEETEAIPSDFFDDLLEDRVAKRIERLQNEEEEIKYSETIKNIREQLRELDESLAVDSSNKHKKHKHKKSKKKSNKRSRNKEDKDYGEFDLDDNNLEEVQRKRRKNSRSPAPQSLNSRSSAPQSLNSRSPAPQSLNDNNFEEAQRKRRKNSRSPAQSLNDNHTEEAHRKRHKNSRSPVTTKKSNNLIKVKPTSELTANEAIYQSAAVNYPVQGLAEELPGPSVGGNLPVASVPDHIPNSSTAFSPFPLPFMLKPEPSILMTDANDDALNCLPVEQPSNSSAFNAFSGFKKIKCNISTSR